MVLNFLVDGHLLHDEYNTKELFRNCLGEKLIDFVFRTITRNVVSLCRFYLIFLILVHTARVRESDVRPCAVDDG